MKMRTRALTVLAGLATVAAGCGDGEDTVAGSDPAMPTVVVTTNILGDVVENLVGDEFEVMVIMPVGADPHDFQPSAQQVASIGEADVLIANGGDFESGLLDVMASVEDAVPTFEAISAVETLEFNEDEHGHEDEDGHEEEHEDEQGHKGADPHFFTDPARMALVADGIIEFLVNTVSDVDGEALRANAQAYIDELDALDAEVEETLAAVSANRRVLVTNHEVFSYFADRYDFEVIGTVIPTGATTDGVSAEGLAELAEVIEHEGVPAIFTDTSSSDQLAQTLADEVGDVQVVELFSESLGEPGTDGATYLEMMRVNASRIAQALGA